MRHRRGLPEEIALPVGKARLLAYLPLGACLDAFGKALDSQLRGHLDQ